MRRLAQVILFVILLSVSPVLQIAHATELEYWESDQNSVKYITNRKIRLFSYSGGNGYATALSYVQTASNQWNSVGIHSYIYDDINNYTIRVHDGSRSVLEDMEPRLKPFWALTTTVDQLVGTYTYNGSVKRKYRIASAKIFVPKQRYLDGWGANHYRSAFTHELGHALGWYGHSANSYDVMRAQFGTNYLLTIRDRRHLYQIYH